MSRDNSYPLLVADVGGTNARFGIVIENHAERGFTIEHQEVLSCLEFSSFSAALEAYARKNGLEVPKRACLSVAGPLLGDRIEMTNLSWVFCKTELTQQHGFKELEFINDFAAQACSIPYIDAEHLVPIKAGIKLDGGAKVILGPGTGVGVASLLRTRAGWHPVSGEGGHVGLSPGSELEQKVMRSVQDQLGYVSVEVLLSGPGIKTLYEALAEVSDLDIDPISSPEEVSERAEEKEPLAVQTLELFCRMLGRLAGDLALINGAKGGVYLAGGILPKIAGLLNLSAFEEGFTSKGAMSHYMQEIPVTMITHPQPALIGAAAWLEGLPDRE